MGKQHLAGTGRDKQFGVWGKRRGAYGWTPIIGTYSIQEARRAYRESDYPATRLYRYTLNRQGRVVASHCLEQKGGEDDD